MNEQDTTFGQQKDQSSQELWKDCLSATKVYGSHYTGMAQQNFDELYERAMSQSQQITLKH